MPVVPVTGDYRFNTDIGPATLLQLIGPHHQLVIRQFLFGIDTQVGCRMCSFRANSFDKSKPHLAARNTAFGVTSNDPNAHYEQHGYSAAIRSGDLVFVSGQVGSREDGSPEAEFKKQVALAFENLKTVLKAAGCTTDDIIDVTLLHRS